jgi:hypothetical protein
MKYLIRSIALIFALILGLIAPAFAQWSSNPAVNLALADDANGSDQVQPKLVPIQNQGWYISWFDNNPSAPPPLGYSVFYQQLNPGGYEQYLQGGIEVAALSNSSTEDYGLSLDTSNNALLAFLDTRENVNQQVTAAKMSVSGTASWGPLGVQLTNNYASNAVPKIVGTSDGNVVVAWTSNSDVVVQKLNSAGEPLWGNGIVFSANGLDYILADLHAADNGSVIVSWVSNSGFGSNSQLRTNKISAAGKLLWGAEPVHIFDTGSLQFGNFPYFVYDGNGGAVFAWYTNSPTLQCFAQHILSTGQAAFPAGGVAVSADSSQVRVDPAAVYRQSTEEVFVFWTEEDALQVYNGVYGQKFNSTGSAQWGADGLTIVPLGTDQQIFVTPVQEGTGALTFWVDQAAYGSATIQAIKLDGNGNTVCPQFAVSSTPSNKSRLAAAVNPAGIAALVFEDDRIGNNGIYIQNVSSTCTLGEP